MSGRGHSPEEPGSPPLTRDHVVWAYRLLLDRDPESEDVVGPKLAGSRDTKDLRRHLMTSAEFREKNPDYVHTNDPTVVIKELNGPGSARLFIDLADHVIGIGILRGLYEPDEVAFVRSVLRPGDCAVDVGAHVGFFSIHMATIVGGTGRVYSFEPFDQNADLLARSIAENEFADRVVLRRAAVGAAAGRSRLAFARETLNTGGAYVLRDGAAPLVGHETREVPVVALDDLIALPCPRPVRLVKMDVEGAEPQVVRGGHRLLREDRPFILSELHGAQLERASGMSPGEFLATMSALGYSAHVLEQGRPGPRLERAPDVPLLSVVFLPR